MSERDQSISNSDLDRLRDLIYAQAGINLGADKRTMLELRLRPRMRSLALGSFHEYCEHLFSTRGQRDEMVHLLDAVTTNKTDFFREPGHFDYLVGNALPELTRGAACGRPLVVWSAGCSSGEEPYTLSIVLSEYTNVNPGFRFRVLATDICTTVLTQASRGIFSSDTVDPVPAELRRRYFMRSRDRGSTELRVVPELRNLVEFRRLNFMDPDYRMAGKIDVIFCRNVIIYFDRPTQERILRKLASLLIPGGYMFLGHSETLHGMNVPLRPVAPAAYRSMDA